MGRNGEPLLGYGAAIVFPIIFIYEYFSIITSIEIMDNGLKVTYPIGKKIIPFSDITDIRIEDTFLKGQRHPEIWVVAKKTYKLRQLGIGPNMLYKTLHNAVKL